jgi:hypothetical protein
MRDSQTECGIGHELDKQLLAGAQVIANMDAGKTRHKPMDLIANIDAVNRKARAHER